MARRDRRNVTDYWWDRRIPGLSLLRADFTDHDYATHTHDAFVIALTESGSARFRSRRTVETFRAGALFVSNPEEPQSSWMGGSRHWRYRSIYLTQAAIGRLARALGIETMPCFTDNLIEDRALIDGVARLHRALEAGGDEFLEQELLIGVLGSLFTRHGSGGGSAARGPRDTPLVAKALDIMRERCAEPLRLDALAGAVGLTSFQLIGAFKRTVGMTPHAYLIQLRLNLACRALRRGAPLADAALEAGFCDQSALTKHFKRRFGITPRQFAEAARPQFSPRRETATALD